MLNGGWTKVHYTTTICVQWYIVCVMFRLIKRTWFQLNSVSKIWIIWNWHLGFRVGIYYLLNRNQYSLIPIYDIEITLDRNNLPKNNGRLEYSSNFWAHVTIDLVGRTIVSSYYFFSKMQLRQASARRKYISSWERSGRHFN